MLPIHCAKKPYEKLADGTVKKVEVPYEIPDSWEWVRLKTIYQVINGDRGKNYPSKDKLFENGEIPFINAGNIANEVISSQNLLYLSEEQYNKLGNGKLIKGDVIFCLRGSLGKFGIFNMEKGAIASSLVIIRPYYNNSKDIDIYFSKYLASPVLLSEIRKYNNGTAQPNLSAKALNNFFIPLPPLAEQKRIVAQIERALEKVEAYAESYNKLQELDRAFPDKLKKSILQYAMQGKLVAQDPNDEPVEVLLEKIRAEKQKLYEEGKLKKKDLAEILTEKGDDNSPYGKIPKSWRINSLNSVANIYTGNSINATEKKTYFSGATGINYIATKDVNFDGSIDYNNGIKIPEDYLSKFKISPANSVLLCLEGGSAGRKIGLLEQEVCFGNKLCSLSFHTGENKFLYYFLQSPQFLSDFQDSKSGIIGGVSVKKLGVITIPMPPQKEQERISSKVEQLFQKVNQFY